MNKITYILFFILTTLGAAAQDEATLIAKVQQKSVVLRIMPGNAATWQKGNDLGWVIKKKAIKTNGKALPNSQAVVLASLQPKTQANFEANSNFAIVAKKLLYENPTQSTEERDLSFGLAMLMSSTSQALAKDMGLLFIDTKIDNKTTYQYSLEMATKPVLNELTIDTEVFTTLLRPQDLQATFADSVATLRWQPGDSLLHMAYVAEISTDQKTWKALNQQPILESNEPDSLGRIFISYETKLPQFYKNYYFRVRAYTPFGIFSNASKSVEIEGYRQRFAAIDPNFDAQSLPIAYTWAFADSLNNEIKGFEIATSRFVDSAYATIATLPPTARSYTDPNAANDTYIKVGIIDWHNHVQFSQPMLVSYEDAIAPAPPIILQKSVDSTGIVKISWQKNKERDLAGYSVLRADSRTDTYNVLNKTMLKDSVFTDTLSLALLNDQVFYLVQAFDTRMNASAVTDTLLIKRPDIIAPAALAYKEATPQENGVFLRWAASASTDVENVLLLRKKADDSTYTLLQTFSALPPATNSYTDTTAQEKQVYQYALVAVDDAGLRSKPAVITMQRLFTGVRKQIEPLVFTPDYTIDAVLISWPLPKMPVKQYVLYRKGPKEGFLMVYKKFGGETGQYLDKNIEPNQNYQYKLQAVFLDDSESSLEKDFNYTFIK